MASSKKKYVASGKVKQTPRNNKNSKVQLEDPTGDNFARRVHKFFCYGLKNSRRTRSLDRSADYIFIVQLILNVLCWGTGGAFAIVLMVINGLTPLNLTNLIILSVAFVIAVVYFVFYFKVYKIKEIPNAKIKFLYTLNWIIKSLRLALPILLLFNDSGNETFNAYILVFSILIIVYSGIALISETIKVVKFYIYGKARLNKDNISLLEKYQKKAADLRKKL